MGYDEITSRNSIHFSFSEILEESNINKIIDKLHLKYMQLKLFVYFKYFKESVNSL